jgi:hypothetical protein
MTEIILPNERVAIRGTCPTVSGHLVRYRGKGKAEVRLEGGTIITVNVSDLRVIRND